MTAFFANKFKHIYKELKERRVVLSHKELGEKLGVTEGTIRNYLHKNREPSYYVVERIVKDLNVNPDWLFYGEGKVFNSRSLHRRKHD